MVTGQFSDFIDDGFSQQRLHLRGDRDKHREKSHTPVVFLEVARKPHDP